MSVGSETAMMSEGSETAMMSQGSETAMMSEGSETRSCEGGHESLHDYPCSLCEDDGQHMEARKFCKECFVYMCDSCVQTKHNRFPLHKSHQMFDKSQFSTVKESSLMSFPTKRCPKNPGELINIYCGEHDIVCCIVCKTLEHSNCDKSQHLLDAAKGINIKSKECQNIIRETETFLKDVEKVLNAGKEEIVRIAEAKQQVKKKIAEFRKRVDKFFNDLETKSIDELQAMESKIISKIEQGVKNLDVNRSGAEKNLKQLQSFKGNNECELFVHIKDCERLLTDSKASVRRVSRSVKKESIYFEVNPNIEEFLKSLETLGSLTNSPVGKAWRPEKPSDNQKQTEQLLQYNYEDREVIDLCVLQDGSTLIMNNGDDYNYITMNAFDKTNKIVDAISVGTGKAVSVCAIGDSRAAVLYNKQRMSVENNINVNVGKIEFVTVGKRLILHSGFSMESPASGMVYDEEKFYVCVKVMVKNISEYEDVGYHIAVYSEDGQLQRYIPQSPGYLKTPHVHMIVNDDSQLLFPYSLNNDIFSLVDVSGNVVNTFTNVNLDSSRWKMCTDDKGNLFVCTRNAEVVHLSLGHQETKVVLTEADGIKNPSAMCFDRKKSRLLILCTVYDIQQNKSISTVHSFHVTPTTR